MAYQPQRDPTNVLGRRFGAFFIDFVLGNAIAIAFLAATKSASYTGAPEHACSRLRNARDFSGTCVQMGSRVYTWESGRYLLGIALGLGVVFLNSVILQGVSGASVGKMITGTRVVNAQGTVAGIGRCFLRWILLFVDLFCAGLVGLITVLSTHPHRRVGDMAAGTYVIGTADVGAPVVAPTAPNYAYAAAPAAGGWAPPQPAQPGWGAAPPGQPAQWGAPQQPAPQAGQSAWGAPTAPAPQSGWPPPPTPQPEQPSWGAPPSAPQQGPQPRPAQPTEERAGWAAPPAPQPSQQQPYVPPPPPQPQPQAPQQQQPYVPPPPPSTAPAQPAPPSWGAPPAPASDPEPPAAAPPAPNVGESWWDKGVEDGNGGDENES